MGSISCLCLPADTETNHVGMSGEMLVGYFVVVCLGFLLLFVCFGLFCFVLFLN